jgi:hypothetical protein
VAVTYPWPESQQRVEDRVQGLVASVVWSGELHAVRIEWVTPRAHQWDVPSAGWVALRVLVSAVGDESYEREVWGPD